MWIKNLHSRTLLQPTHTDTARVKEFSIAVREHSDTRVDKNVDDGWTSSLFP